MRNLVSGAALCVLIAAAIAGADAELAAQEPNFGRAVVLHGDELFVGQPVNWYGPGMVYGYRLENGRWVEQGRLTASDSSRMDDFGRALAIDDNTLVIGAPRKREGAGVAYAFRRTGASAPWEQQAIILPPGDGPHREFASALHLSGDELLIGAPGPEGTGVIHRYRRNGSDWALAQTIRPTDGAAGFGAAFSVDGDRMIVGAPASDTARGRVYVVQRQGGAWSTPVRVDLPQPNLRANTGASVVLRGDRAWVGAPGAAIVTALRAVDGSWRADGEFRPEGDARGSQFGAALEHTGSELWVGAPGMNSGNGRVFRYATSSSSPSVRILDADSADGNAWPFAFGYAIAAADGRAVVSMPSRDFGEGRVLALTRAGDDWRAQQILEGHIFRIGATAQPGDRCEDGTIGEFTCRGVQLVSHMTLEELGGERGAWVNDVWGWTDPETGRDYALVARRDGSSFVDVTDPTSPRLIGNLPRTPGSPPSVWRDIKVNRDHAFIVADGARAHGMQVFDLRRLRTVTDTPAVFAADTTYALVHSAHNVVADTASGFVYIVGANGGGETCGGGLHIVDVREPKNPVFIGCYNDRGGANPRGYTHDAQCLVYEGPDERYRGRQICVGSNEREINIADVTDKENPITVGRNSYPDVAYAHQGWFDAEQRYFYMNDELDELAGSVAGTRTIVWDLARLDDPVVAHEYIGPVPASDHNLFVVGNRMFQSNYGSGLRVIDITERTRPREIGFFDSAPYNDDEPGHSAATSGAWSNYPFFRSGVVIFTSVREGLFIIRVNEPVPVS